MNVNLLYIASHLISLGINILHLPQKNETNIYTYWKVLLNTMFVYVSIDISETTATRINTSR